MPAKKDALRYAANPLAQTRPCAEDDPGSGKTHCKLEAFSSAK